MGYYTNYELEIIKDGHNSSIDNISKESWSDFKEATIDYKQELEGMIYYDLDGCIPWYDYQKDMTEFSKKYPKTIFKLSGEGREGDNSDMWVEYYKNGKVQRCEAIITFEPYDESKLK